MFLGCVVVNLELKFFKIATVAMVTMKVKGFFYPIVMKLHMGCADVHSRLKIIIIIIIKIINIVIIIVISFCNT